MRYFFFLLKALRKLYLKQHLEHKILLVSEQNPESVSKLIFETLMEDTPCMIARFGANELSAVVNFVGINSGVPNLLLYIKGLRPDWVWNDSIIKNMANNAGFFPPTFDKVSQFCELMLRDISKVDVLGSWLQNELYVEKQLEHSKLIRLMYLDPFWAKNPWTRALKGKRILVVHPFANSISSQYRKRIHLFANTDILPEFKSLEVIQAVQSLGNGDDRFSDWFEALAYMKKEIEKHEFDICLIGCGAYGFPLAAHVKRIGKKAVHMGGSLQLLFGIRGKRWEDDEPHYVMPENVFVHYSGLPNEHWVRPSVDERPNNHLSVENSCYW
ncbi:MAG: hypothetical protein WKF66_19215 [Pedobacter sp.]